MNDPNISKRGRPKKHYGTDVKLNVRVDKVLWNAVYDDHLSQSFVVTRALRKCLNEGRQDNLAAIKIAMREARKEISHGTSVIAESRERLKKMGIDPDEVEEHLWDE